MEKRILLLEDEEHLSEVIKMNLEMEGYEVITASDGKKAVKAFAEQRFSLAILDVMVPELNGFDVCEQIRLDDAHIPIIFLTAKDSSIDRINGLKRGADDYLTKPFNLEEFILRVKSLLKRGAAVDIVNENEMIEYRFGKNYVNFTTFEAQCETGNVTLTKKEVKLLKLLVERKGEVVSRNLILQNVWGYDVFPTTRTIDNFILNFRKYFEPNFKEPVYFHSVRGVGYKFVEA
jgi:two-component system alkaline phosphatase synthesis response regulator PhoP